MTDVLIVGAGAAGLMAARELARQQKSIVILEARNRTGGRIHTVHEDKLEFPAELGAEFIHGKLPVTLNLLKEAGIKVYPMEGKMIREEEGELSQSEYFTEGWSLFTKRLKQLKRDVSIADFLEQNFSEEKYSEIRETVRGFAEGYDAADLTRASALALRDEWMGGDDEAQYRVRGGYGAMIHFLEEECLSAGCVIHLSSVVRKVEWKRDTVSVITEDEKKFTAKKVIVTVPLGVLQQKETATGAITFSPAIPKQMKAIQSLGYGAVIKVLLLFHDAFWKEKEMRKRTGVNLENMSFLFCQGTIPTWWTQFPEETPLLTGWLGGPNAEKLTPFGEEIILQKSLGTLAAVFQITTEELKEKLSAWHVVNWPADPYARGAYTYATVGSSEARKILSTSVDGALFFAGEALYEGSVMGTVEAALVSGVDVAKKILSV
ncbi:MAG TPA: NAD(P)/FAD-dependent oxidoreductase [Chitinophagales bacterium]|nr:NAD(P)/FAD-dependent oxidoreductase [Chitinophagales bacterium]